MTEVRRSGRTRKQTASYYDEAKKKLEQEPKLRRSSKHSPDIDLSDEEVVDEDVAMMDQEEQDARDDNEKDSDDDGDSNDNDESPRKNKKRQTSRKGKSDSTKTAGTSRKTGKAQVKVRTSTLHKLTNTAQRGKGAGGRNVFVALAKRVLEEDETLETSLTAAILDAGKKSAQSTQASLENMARKIIQKHRDDANATQVELINLIFRSVGGSTASFLEDGTDLEDMDGDKWANVITNLVDDMRYTAPDCVLICSDPEGAQHAVAVASNKVSKDSTSYQPLSEYRKLYEQFWHTLAEVALQQTGRFAIEMVRDWIMCVNELLEVCQPDIRAAAVAASLAMTIVMLDRTVALRDKMETASRQFQAATKNRGDSNTKLSTKAESLKHQVDSLKRSIQDLEEIIESNVTAVFVNRYRDSDEHIRAANIRALAKMTLLRPDLYLCDRFLKYMGWTLSDTAVTVRLAALEGLAAPFQAKSRKIDIGRMSNVIRKFLPRLADCTIDVDVRVQEKAMALFLLLDRANFLEDLEDDLLWEQVNIRALAQDTSPNVRRDALYFVIDQLEAFDNAEDEEEDKKQSRSKSWSKDKNASLVQSSDNAASKKLGALAEWVAHSLTRGPIPVERIRIELTDYVVDSLRAMPEHRSLVTNWSALARAIHEGGEGIHESGVGKDDAKEADRIVTAKMQVLIRILSRSAQAEVSSVAPEFLTQDVDRDVADIISADLDAKTSKPKSGKGGKPSTSHEVLSVALLKALPELLAKFKSDPRILESITRLPRLLIPSVISLPQRKNDFNDLLKNLAEIFLSSGDDIVLKNISRSLAFLSNGDHVRAKDVRFQFQQLCQKLRQRTLELLDDDGAADDQAASKKKQKSPKKKKRRSIVADEGSEEGDDTAKEFTLALFLKRISILSNIVDLRELLEVDGDTAAEGMFDSMRDGIIGGISSRLSARQVVENEEGKDIRSKEIWRKGDRNLHSCFTDSVKSALRFLLTSFAWRLLEAQGEDPILIAGLDLDLEKRQEDDSDDEMNIHSLVQQRDQLVDFILLCFRPLVPVDRVEEYSDDQILASESIQTAACHAACDLRMLLPKEWAEAKSPLLRAVALLDDQPLVFGCVRFFKTKETDLRDIELDNFDDIEKVCDLLLPLGRVFVSDWSSSNRREAGYVIAHIVGSGQASNQLVTILSRIVKKIDPLHLLETHMASLRCSFDDWLMSEPEELASDRPTDKEMAAFEEAENAYKERFELLVHQASRFSQSLGVGKVDPQLENPLLGFVKEGVRYAFSTDMSNGEDPLMPGGRLTFLALIGKYLHWVKRHKSFREVIVDNFLEREEDLRDDPEFDQVHADDIEALEAFRKLIGVKDTNVSHSKSPRSIADSQFSEGEEEESFEDTSLRGKSPASANAQNKRTRLSRDSSIGSGSINRSRSRTLSPLPEEDTDTVDDEEGESPSKRRKMNKGARKSSVGSALTMTTLDKGLNSTIEEEDESDASDTY